MAESTVSQPAFTADAIKAVLRRAYPVPDLDKAFRETAERFARECGQ